MATAPHARSSLRRTACDRCRHSKLRCLRDENQQKCTRCLRLDLRCEVAPAKPPGRPRKVVSTPPAAAESSSHAEPSTSRLSPEFLGTEGQSPPGAQTPESQNSVPPDQSLENMLPRLDDQGRPIGGFGHSPLPSHSNMNSYSLTSMIPYSEFGTPEWYEATSFDADPSARDPLEVHSLFTAKLDRHECLKELSQLNVDLHKHWRALQELIDSDRINFATFLEHPPPPAGDGVSLAEKFLIMSQRFQQAITNLNWVVNNEPRSLSTTTPVVVDDDMILDPLLNIEGPLPVPLGPDAESSDSTPEGADTGQGEPLETPFACLLVSCYVQLVKLWELMFVHVHRRVSGVDRSHFTLSDPSKGVQMGAFYIFSGRLQSMFFCQAVLYFQDNIDRGLGILPEQREQGVSGLLSHPRHFNLLQRELGGQVSRGGSERVRELRDAVERTRVFTFHDIGW